MLNCKCRKIAVVLFLSMLSPLVQANALTDQAKLLLDQGKGSEAFALLDPQESARAGDVNFDLLFGIAAVDAGQNTRGVFALERVLAVQPGNARARAEIARAYLALGETSTAKQEFSAVQKQGVPPEVSATIDRFLDAVDRLDNVSRTTVRAFVEAAGGYDSNVNAATGRNSVAMPGFGGQVTLSPNSVAIPAWFATLGAGLVVRKPVNSELALVGGLSGVQRNDFGASQFDNLSGDAYAGVLVSQDKSVYSLNAQFNQYNLASARYRTASGLSGQWQYNMDARNQASVFGQYSNLLYPTQSPQDADRWVAGGAYAHAFRGGEVVFGSAYWVNETPHNGAYPWLGFNGMGLRAGGQMNYNASTVLFANAVIERRDYRAENPAFQATRKDTQYDLILGANYTPARYWTLTPRITWTSNDSNVQLYEYNRSTVSVTVRRDFW